MSAGDFFIGIHTFHFERLSDLFGSPEFYVIFSYHLGSSGIGGGCYILTHNSTTLQNNFIDSREYAPSASTSDMFEKDPVKAQDGGLAIAVFSELKGIISLLADIIFFYSTTIGAM